MAGPTPRKKAPRTSRPRPVEAVPDQPSTQMLNGDGKQPTPEQYEAHIQVLQGTIQSMKQTIGDLVEENATMRAQVAIANQQAQARAQG